MFVNQKSIEKFLSVANPEEVFAMMDDFVFCQMIYEIATEKEFWAETKRVGLVNHDCLKFLARFALFLKNHWEVVREVACTLEVVEE